MKCAPPHFVAEQLPHLVLFINLGFHALTGCYTMLLLSGNGKNTCCMFIKYSHFPTGVVMDDNVDDVCVFLCSLYGNGEKDVRGIDVLLMPVIVFFCESEAWPRCVLPPTHVALSYISQG